MKVKPSILVLFGMLSAHVYGQTPEPITFNIRNWGRGSGFEETLISADGVLFANTYRGTVFRSLDTGKSWRPFPVPGVNTFGPISDGIHFDAVSGLVYAFSNNGAYAASPRANAWTWVYDNVPQYYSIEGSTLVFSDEVGVMISRDGGKFWKGIDGGRFLNRGKVLAAGGCAYIGSFEDPISVSCDGGTLWKTAVGDTLTQGVKGLVAYQGAVIALAKHGLVHSLDSGKTWVRWPGNLSDDSALRDLSLSENALIANRWEPVGFCRSVDGGRTWVTHPLPDSDNFHVNSSPIAAIGGKLVYHSSQGLKVSENGGLTWMDSNPRAISGAIQALAVQGRAFLALSEQGIFTSGDTGITWELSLPADSNNPWTKLIAAGGLVAVGGSDGTVRISADAGAHWSRPLPLPASDSASPSVKSLAVFGGTVVAASAQGIWRLSLPDSGWKAFPLPVAEPFRALGSGSSALLVATDSHLWKLRPDGTSEDLSAGIPILKIMGLWIIEDRTYAYTSDGNLRQWDASHDMWVTGRQFDRHVLSLAGSQNSLLAATYTGLSVSGNAGATWDGREVIWNGSGFGSSVNGVKAVACEGGFLYAGDNLGGIWQSPVIPFPVSVLSRVGAAKPFRVRSPLGILSERGRRVDGRFAPINKRGIP
ncbi:MAG: hypothetical protein ABI036_01215 [Fibrobacteria bacterium]